MTDIVTVTHLVGGTVTERVHTGEHVTSQQFLGGRAVIKVYRDGRVVQIVQYAQAEVIDRTIGEPA